MTWDKQEVWVPSDEKEWEAWKRRTIRRAHLLNLIIMASFGSTVGIGITLVLLSMFKMRADCWQIGMMIFTNMILVVASIKRTLDTTRNLRIIENLKKQGYLRVVRSGE